MSTIQELSNGFASVVAQAGESVARVEGRRRGAASGIIWSGDGLLVTANHVVHREDNLRVGLADGQTLEATLLGRDPSTDLALLKVTSSGLRPLDNAGEPEMSVGHLTLALGRPGRTVQATFGIISALGAQWRTPMGGQIDNYLQTDVVMYPGFSGGPLVGADGRLLGLNTSGLGQGVSLAIPTATIARVVESLQSHGRIRRGYLGVSTQRVRLPDELAGALGQKAGLLIISVEPGSPAAEAGMSLGDTIVTLGGKPVVRHEDLLAGLSGDVVGQKEVIQIVRGGQTQELTVKIGERE
ncbi:MAG: trypsin-like peptidase domain-containing protein [Anaerolineae bacterium]|uniref:S1C family serine protease n=1 Tax=Promineifilum sp. TaxID=2664178 RepID=UPI001DE9D6AD|nr:trypsin-like peptidase domain-containing protein [Anaerolineales bacterium]MCB8934648.1 trypsin-like peptidase domain-containing protein [Promineifilum sp.]MCO5180836.1 S1C family serine protease [Promineifilum sp.]MCW5846644.1 trypsin-like peptidase domain-containing protein [Anaerolineae bacterium]